MQYNKNINQFKKFRKIYMKLKYISDFWDIQNIYKELLVQLNIDREMISVYIDNKKDIFIKSFDGINTLLSAFNY